MNNKDSKKTISIGWCEIVFNILAVAFVVLKFLGVEPVAGWSWWLVLSLLLLLLGICLAIWFVVGVILLVDIWSSPR